MSSEDNAAVARALNDAFNDRDWRAAVALTTPDVALVNLATGQTYHGPQGVEEFLGGWAGAFPDSKVETTDVVADDRGAAMEFIGRGTHTGPLESPMGAIPPTGRQVEVHFCQTLVMHNGKVSRARLYFDLGGMLRQLGLLPS